ARCPIPEDARENLWFCGCGVAEPLRWNWAGWLRLRLGDQGSEHCCNLLVGASPRSVPVPVLRVEMDRMDRIFKRPFLWPELYRSPGRVSIPVLLDEKSTVVPVRLAGEQSGGKRKVSYGDARSNSERAAPSACVGRRLSVPQIV